MQRKKQLQNSEGTCTCCAVFECLCFVVVVLFLVSSVFRLNCSFFEIKKFKFLFFARLIKNRESALASRQRKKQHVDELVRHFFSPTPSPVSPPLFSSLPLLSSLTSITSSSRCSLYCIFSFSLLLFPSHSKERSPVFVHTHMISTNAFNNWKQRTNPCVHKWPTSSHARAQQQQPRWQQQQPQCQTESRPDCIWWYVQVLLVLPFSLLLFALSGALLYPLLSFFLRSLLTFFCTFFLFLFVCFFRLFCSLSVCFSTTARCSKNPLSIKLPIPTNTTPPLLLPPLLLLGFTPSLLHPPLLLLFLLLVWTDDY